MKRIGPYAMIPNIRTERKRKSIGYARAIPATAGVITLFISGFAFPIVTKIILISLCLVPVVILFFVLASLLTPKE